MKKKSNRNNYKRKNYTWETLYKIKRHENEYKVDKRKEETSLMKVISAIIAIMLTLAMLTFIRYFLKDNSLMKTVFEVADIYIFIGLTTFVIFLVFKTNIKEYNKNKKGEK